MYNKIAAIILNSAKSAGLSDVFVAQPDAIKENLAGKFFILAEIGGKKTEGKKIFDFLKASLEDYYYNDEKIIFRDKIEGLKLENIFEAAVAKTNKNFQEFLKAEKIKINPEQTSITLGLIYQNKLHFANFGRNRSLLFHRRADNYELINVEANAADLPSVPNDQASAGQQVPQLFSSLISGEIPSGSYFLFASEALPEYLSASEMIKIITKLPPLTAAAQIRNTLASINTYVPFLGIIIKNTMGLPTEDWSEDKELILSSAQGSISSLNYTEQKTEAMLAPAGVINLSNFFKKTKSFIKESVISPLSDNWHSLISASKSSKASTAPALDPLSTSINQSVSDDNLEKMTYPAGDVLEMGKIKSLDGARQHAGLVTKERDSFLIKEKIIFKKKSGLVLGLIRKIFLVLGGFFRPHFWPAAMNKFLAGLKNLSRQRLGLVISLAVLVLILVSTIVLSINQKTRQALADELAGLMIALEKQEDAIDFYLLYNDEAGALRSLVEAQAILDSWPQNNKEQREAYEVLAQKLQLSAEKVQRLERITAADQIRESLDDKINNLSFAQEKIYAAGLDLIKEIIPAATAEADASFTIGGTPELNRPFFDGANTIYYWNQGQILSFNVNNKRTTNITFSSASPTESSAFKFYSRYFYSLAPSEDQINRYNYSVNNISAKTDWLTETIDLSRATDLYVDGNIYVLNRDGQVFKFYLNKIADFKSAPLSPVMTQAEKILLGNKHIYIFESSSKRLAVLNKDDGSLVKQYLLEFAVAPQDFALDEDNRLVYILDQGQLLSFPITH